MPSLSRQIRRARRRLEARNQSDEENVSRLRRAGKRVRNEVSAAKSRVVKPFEPATTEAREITEETHRLGQALKNTREGQKVASATQRATSAAAKSASQQKETLKRGVSKAKTAASEVEAFAESESREVGSLEEFAGMDVSEDPFSKPLNGGTHGEVGMHEVDNTPIDPVGEDGTELDFGPVDR